MIVGPWTILSLAVAAALSVVICTFGLVVAYRLAIGKIDLTYLLAEPADPQAQRAVRDRDLPPEAPKASVSRFQFLIFTFVISGVYLVLCLEAGRFVDIPANVVLLLGVSGTTYAASKGIQTAGAAKGNAAPVTTNPDGV